MDVIVIASLSCIFFSIWPPVAVNIHFFLFRANDGLGRGYRRNSLSHFEMRSSGKNVSHAF